MGEKELTASDRDNPNPNSPPLYPAINSGSLASKVLSARPTPAFAGSDWHNVNSRKRAESLAFSRDLRYKMGMDDPREAARIIDCIATSVMPDLMAKVGEAYLRGFPFMLRHGADGLDVKIIPADQFYITPDSPSERKR